MAGSDRDREDVVRRPSGSRHWPGAAALAAALVLAFLAVGFVGAAENARGERILPFLDPVIGWIRTDGSALTAWLIAHSRFLGWAVTSACALTGLGGLVVAGRRGAPVFLAAAAVCLASWGQVCLQEDRTSLAMAFYAAGVACAFLLGLRRPMARLDGFPRLPLPGRRRETPAPAGPRPPRGLPWLWECALVFALTVVALLSRTYALTEKSHFLDLETVAWWIESRTAHGVASYLSGFTQTNGGAIQIFPQFLVFHLFGTSIYALRLSAVLWTIATVPLMYFLVRRIAGSGPALVSTILFLSAPEQLFWARSENTFFAPVAALALATVFVALWMAERFSPFAVLLAALLTPVCRFFYTTCMALLVLPGLVAAHAVLFVRGAWRKTWYVAPILAAGVAMWVFSLTFVKAALHGGDWHFVNPAAVYGGPVWAKQGEFNQASPLELLRLQAVSVSKNLANVAADMTYSAHGFSHWYVRSQPTTHRTTVNVAIVVGVALGLGYFLAQIYERRAFLLLAWVGISLLPGIMSADPAARRMAMFFPAFHVIFGVMCGVVVRVARQHASALVAWVAGLGIAVALAGVALTNLVSHFALPMRPVLYGDYVEFTKPLFEHSDAIFTNFPIAFRNLIVFGSLDRFLEHPICVQGVEPKDWLSTALEPKCDFRGRVFSLSMPPERVEELKRSYDPRRISFLLFEQPETQSEVDLLRALYPAAESREFKSPINGQTLLSMTVGEDTMAAARTPALETGTAGVDPTRVLQGVPLRPRAPSAGGGVSGEGMSVRGGLLLDHDGWYGFGVDPPCPQAELRIDDRVATLDDTRPMLTGVHPFALTLPDPPACALPLRLETRPAKTAGVVPLAPDRLVGPAIASVEAARARTVEPYPGYTGGRPVALFRGRAVDLGVDARGVVGVAVLEQGALRVERIAPSGKRVATFDVEQPLRENAGSIAVDPDGNTAILTGNVVQIYDAAGQRTASWSNPWFVWESELVFWGPDEIVANIPHRNSIAVFDRSGTLLREVTDPAGSSGGMYRPIALVAAPNGDVLVQESNGQALLLHSPAGDFDPTFVRRFPVGAQAPGGTFDGDRLILPDGDTLQVYGTDGERRLAADPAHDLSTQPFGHDTRAQAAPRGRLWVLDPERARLWALSRLP
jgi:hypothetical protein